MARVTYSPGVTKLAGSIGGLTYQRNAFGNTIKQRSTSTINPTPQQTIYQTRLAELISFWPTLSQADKDLWNDHATAHNHTTPWGKEKTLSGYQWFLSCNLHRLSTWPTPLSHPEAWVAYDPPQEFTLTANSIHFKLIWNPPYNPNADIWLYLTLPLRQASLKLRRPLFLSDHFYFHSVISEWDITYFFESLANVTWADFYASSKCSIICQLARGDIYSGWISSYTSAIVKINS